MNKSVKKYMKNISKEKDLEISMARRIYKDNLDPIRAANEVVSLHVGYVTFEECMNAWKRVEKIRKENYKIGILFFSFFILLLFLSYII